MTPDIGEQYFKELREHLATNSQKLKWQRIADAERHSNGTIATSIPTRLMDRYIRENNESKR